MKEESDVACLTEKEREFQMTTNDILSVVNGLMKTSVLSHNFTLMT